MIVKSTRNMLIKKKKKVSSQNLYPLCQEPGNVQTPKLDTAS